MTRFEKDDNGSVGWLWTTALTYTGTNPAYIYGGNTAGDDIKIFANDQETYPSILLEGNTDVTISHANNEAVIFKETTNTYWQFKRDSTTFTTEATTANALSLAGNTVTTGAIIYIAGGGLTTGAYLSCDGVLTIDGTGQLVYAGATSCFDMSSIPNNADNIKITASAGTPSDPVNPAGWWQIDVGGATRYIPFHA